MSGTSSNSTRENLEFQNLRRTIFAGRALVYVTTPVVNWNKFNSYWDTLLFKPPKSTSAANKD
jgi:hypothetical protein